MERRASDMLNAKEGFGYDLHTLKMGIALCPNIPFDRPYFRTQMCLLIVDEGGQDGLWPGGQGAVLCGLSRGCVSQHITGDTHGRITAATCGSHVRQGVATLVVAARSVRVVQLGTPEISTSLSCEKASLVVLQTNRPILLEPYVFQLEPSLVFQRM